VGGLAIGDLNGDGRPDLATSNYDAGTVSVLMNTLGVCHVRQFEGKTRPAAKAALARRRCRVGSVTRAYSKTVAEGRVIRAESRFGAFWPKGPEVELVVSRGRKP
jgi:beta-lactam-binding protein with PASTA domain